MCNDWDFQETIKHNALKRLVEDGNLLQSLISKLDLQLSTNQESNIYETLAFISTTLSQTDADCTSLESALHF